MLREIRPANTTHHLHVESKKSTSECYKKETDSQIQLPVERKNS